MKTIIYNVETSQNEIVELRFEEKPGIMPDRLFIGEEAQKLRLLNKTGIDKYFDFPFVLDGKEYVFARRGDNSDFYLDGVGLTTGQSYAPAIEVAKWIYVLAIACLFVPIITLGGFFPILLGVSGCSIILALARNDAIKPKEKNASVIAVTLFCWGLAALMLITGGYFSTLGKYKEKTFTKEGFSITLTNQFGVFQNDDEAFYDLEYEDCGIFIYREEIEEGASVDLKMLETYICEQLKTAYRISHTIVESTPERLIITYDVTKTDENGNTYNYTYYTVNVLGKSYVWSCDIIFDYEDKAELADKAVQWAKSIVVD